MKDYYLTLRLNESEYDKARELAKGEGLRVKELFVFLLDNYMNKFICDECGKKLNPSEKIPHESGYNIDYSCPEHGKMMTVSTNKTVYQSSGSFVPKDKN